MQKILEKYHKKMEQLNVFERQTLKTLLAESTSNGMSRFYMAFGKKTVVSNEIKRTFDRS